ncbi:Two component transcriptional regulator, winged helix family OS=Tsukamurella paurometabola (strain ATCC 8368 / DSM / CCUG 35730 / CIP 100753 / JCM 10117/ KCTC 9821 / NBRC 16120 / NCIMB 702349 / NCTC 13040) OX=521096 GN=Tpau_0097 PE=4 SV=1 [Tsukamurella paurometabola]|uniref:Two component transcriptional regulator, winged helix family n=1 Tax=Tsukamurella paurometabola (strain ATCC 8368 / DSM 20162 / CCUG 35730 / CIP 100753 / JCM 10117 / KCTC 9821 / NBRC 16120 / NCIMB 702349 / NCTC 13040) TaxID=521096 RepID=D5UPY3_TSUPD|nr:response regulator transcription factor [Tsukamurella paurometabola]ADG76751.1 two component transcriptional regulator, winged helix family [Tsukamurella paurometabola DSM 20162]SUP41472.1 Transcriptional regulatory protein AfsQ1 [Tsukamurella paurometabola]
MVALLLIEDDPAIVDALTLSLQRLDYQVAHLPSAPDDLDDHVSAADAVILDVGLPGEDGFAVCRRIRRTSQVPILMLTARADDIDTVAGLESGADDYVVKPVSPRVLDARIKAALRRSAPAGAAPETVVAEPAVPAVAVPGTGLVVDRAAAEVLRDGAPLPLTPTEKRLMYVFADHPGQVLSREQLLTLVWNQDFLGDSRLVDNAILRLRPKVDPPGEPSCIETVRGFGYRFRAG